MSAIPSKSNYPAIQAMLANALAFVRANAPSPTLPHYHKTKMEKGVKASKKPAVRVGVKSGTGS